MSKLVIPFLKLRIEELERQLLMAQTATSTAASNALTALEDGDEEEVIQLLKAIAGEE